MSVAAALKFIQQVRADSGLKAQIEALGRAAELAPVIEIGQAAGFTFTDADLRQAFKHDWAMRWLRYGGTAQPPGAPGPLDSEPDR